TTSEEPCLPDTYGDTSSGMTTGSTLLCTHTVYLSVQHSTTAAAPPRSRANQAIFPAGRRSSGVDQSEAAIGVLDLGLGLVGQLGLRRPGMRICTYRQAQQ